MKLKCSGIILAGGQNTRFSGKNKALFHIGGKSIIDHIYSVFDKLFQEIILVTNDPLNYLEWDLNIVTDLFPVQSSLTGIHAGLFYATRPFAFITACDTPFLKKELAETIVRSIEPGIDIVIPETSKGLEPLCAVYSKKCIKPIERDIARQELRIQQFFRNVHIKHLSEKILRKKDPDLKSFININTPGDLVRARAMIK